MNRQDAEKWLLSRGYTFKGKNAYLAGRSQRRYVLGKLVLRFEVKTEGGHWVMVRHGYYGQMNITAENKISGLKSWAI